MRATKAIQQGEEIFNDYGPLPRSELLRRYGYITDNYAKYDVVEVEHDLLVEVSGMRNPDVNEQWLRREEVLDELGIIDDGYDLPRPEQDATLEAYLPGNIHMLLRGLCLESNGMKSSQLKSQESLSIEEAALLKAVAIKKLSQYSTALAEDRKSLNSHLPSLHNEEGLMDHRKAMALQVVIGEKEILHHIINMCETYVVKKTKEIAANGKKRKNSDPRDAIMSKKVARNKR
jgi:SET domain-containing protein 6